MLGKVITSKTRIKILKLFLSNIDDRYYLRELERKLDESLSPLRRQLLKLQNMGILVAEYEANLKYYRLNKNFTGIEELRRLVLGKDVAPAPKLQPQPQTILVPRHMRYDTAILTLVSIFVLGTAAFIVYANTRNIAQVASLMTQKTAQGSGTLSGKKATATRPDEMVSRRWKLLPGNTPALSSGEAGGSRRGQEF